MGRILFIVLGLAGAVCCAATAAAAEAGRVVFVTGKVELASHPAALDNAVQEGDELSTGADGYVYVKTVDSGFLILRPNSRARVTTYHVDLQHPANTRVKLELLGGVARSISGLAVKQARQNFRFNTPVAAIGVRGTDFIVYTDQQTSRVEVVSGGVVVSGFAGACGPDGGGPCEGSASRELFAGQSGVLLQVQRGQSVPQLLHSPALAPDANTPPRSDEPVGKVTLGLGFQQPVDVNLDAQKAANPVLTQQPSTTQVVTPPPVVVVVPVTPPVTPPVPPVIVRSQPEVFWGRWTSVAGMPPDPTALDKVSGNTVTGQVFVGSYVMARSVDPTFVMPHDGVASFQLQSSEVAMQKAGQAEVLAAVGDDARLTVDFAGRTFSTSLTVLGQGEKLSVSGKGDISSNGSLQSGPLSDSVVRGYLGGAHAEEAGYLFLNTSTPGISVQGATKWTR